MGPPFIITVNSIISKDVKPHVCEICSQCFEDVPALDKHYKSHTKGRTERKFSKPERKPFNCGNCNRTFFKERMYRYHCCPKLGDRPHPCHLCSKRFTKRKFLLTHLTTHEKRHTCEFCGKSFSNKRALLPHLRRHTGDLPYVCEFCQKKFPDSHYLQLHLNTHKKPYQCTFCDKSFALKQKLVDHTRKHEGKENYTCMYCHKSFSFKAYLERHQCSLDPTNPYTCKMCNKTFSVKYIWEKHTLIHLENKPYSCSICKKSYMSPRSLKQHEDLHHNAENVLSMNMFRKHRTVKKVHEVIEKKQLSSESYSMCSVNKVKKPHPSSITMKIDVDENLMQKPDSKHKLHLCEVCNKSFTRNFDLKRHQIHVHKIHQCQVEKSNKGNKCDMAKDNKSHQCQVDKGNQYQMAKDNKIHQSQDQKDKGNQYQMANDNKSNQCQMEKDSKSHQCPICGKIFTYRISLDYHHCKNSKIKLC